MSGEIPSQLGNLSNLQYLSLRGNQLSGEIPSQLGNLSNLADLDLSSNQLSGAIPSQLGNLSNLTGLVLHANQLSGAIPSQLGNLSNLTSLSLYLNQLSGGIPSQLGNLSNLQYLNLRANQLTGCIPAGLRDLPLKHNDFDELGLPFCDANAPPIFEVTRSLAENSPPGTNVGAPVAATDPNGNSLTYSLSGGDAGSFELDAATGQLTTKAGVTYTYETKPSYAVTVTASNGRGGAAAVNVTIQLTAEDETQAPNTPATGAPAITGTVQVGHTLTADTSGIADANGLTNVSYSYQWLSSRNAAISGAVNSTYQLPPSDANKAIKVRVTFTDDAGYEETLTSAATDPVAEAQAPNTPATGAPAITGTVQVGHTLTADTSGIADANGLSNVSYSYQWLSSRDTAISGAVNSAYQLQPSDTNKAIKVRVTFTDDAGHQETLTSAATAPVEGSPPPLPTANAGPDLTGEPGESVTLQGTGSRNPYGAWWRMAHQWTQLSGPSVTLTHPNAERYNQAASKFGDPRLTLPEDAADDTTLVFQLTVTDREGGSDTDTMTVTVAPASGDGG